jgi:uncharacterized membrane protein
MDKIILIIFLIYTFFGAIFEHLSYYIGKQLFQSKEKYLSNPILTGFPLYGLGGLLIYYLYDKYFRSYSPITLFFVFGFILSSLEYLVGKYIVNAGKSNKGVISWDYHDEPFNYEGIISLRHFIMWGIVSLVVIKIQPILQKKLQNIL